MSQRERLMDFIKAKIDEHHAELDGELLGNTSLLKSGVLDSLAVLQLAAWIEQELGAAADLSSIDVSEAWDTVDNIMEFVERNQKA